MTQYFPCRYTPNSHFNVSKSDQQHETHLHLVCPEEQVLIIMNNCRLRSLKTGYSERNIKHWSQVWYSKRWILLCIIFCIYFFHFQFIMILCMHEKLVALPIIKALYTFNNQINPDWDCHNSCMTGLNRVVLVVYLFSSQINRFLFKPFIHFHAIQFAIHRKTMAAVSQLPWGEGWGTPCTVLQCHRTNTLFKFHDCYNHILSIYH